MIKKLFHPNRGFCTLIQSPKPWLFIGLGNPGDKFKGTRHNVGFNMIDTFAESQGIAMDTIFCKAIFGKGMSSSLSFHLVFLLFKSSFMIYDIGSIFGPLAAYYKLPLNRVVVFHDDMDLPCGVLRLQPKGGHGRHNGMKSVIHHFRRNRTFARLRIGIGKPPGQMDPKAFLLQKFNATAQERINVGLKEGVNALKEVVAKGVEESCMRFNIEQKYKYIKVADDADTSFRRFD
ncbi:hypothetical protein R6Q57_017117 [Mikania cordata]